MKDWPKKVEVSIEDPSNRYGMADVEVIPADLGRELYEALEQVRKAHLLPPDAFPSARTALNRYEREVGLSEGGDGEVARSPRLPLAESGPVSWMLDEGGPEPGPKQMTRRSRSQVIAEDIQEDYPKSECSE